MDKHEIFMRKALEEARLAEEEGEIPVGAVVVCKGRVIARAHNQTERLNVDGACGDACHHICDFFIGRKIFK